MSYSANVAAASTALSSVAEAMLVITHPLQLKPVEILVAQPEPIVCTFWPEGILNPENLRYFWESSLKWDR